MSTNNLIAAAGDSSGVSIKDRFLLNINPKNFWGGTPVSNRFNSITDIISVILPNILMVSGIILLFLLIFGGFTVISSAGNAENTEKGKQAITGAIIGFGIMFAAYWIVQIIEIITGITILDPSGII
jgi:prepilin signal peptidase PulO-like enzyme (type II secretory pathway)